MVDLILYGHPDSGHSYKVRLALTVLELAHEYREVEVFAPREARRADWRKVSRFGEIPVLIDGGKAIVQSDAILLHLARTRNALGWAGRSTRTGSPNGCSGRPTGSASPCPISDSANISNKAETRG